MPNASDVHVIRLREPWEREVPTADGERQATGDDLDSIRFHRRFGLPTGLEPGDRIELVIEGATASGEVWLNDVLLGQFSAEAAVTKIPLGGLLQFRNQLTITFGFPPGERIHSETRLDRFIREVRLEILQATK
jgi:hypothetical protein